MKVNASVFPVIFLVFATIVFPAIAQEDRLAILDEPFPVVQVSQGLVEVGLITNVGCKLHVSLPADFPVFTTASIEIETNMSLWMTGGFIAGRELDLDVVLPAGFREATLRVNGKNYGKFQYEITSELLAESEIPLIQADLS
jgi:hypothetical protein